MPRSRPSFLLPILLLCACGNSPSAPGVSYDPTLDVDAEVDSVEADDAGRRRPDPSPIATGGGRSDAGQQSELDGSSNGGATDAGSGGSSSDARAQELGAFNAVERLLVADGRSARVHVLDVPSRNYLDSFSLSGPGSIYAGPDGRHGYVLESAQNLVQIISLGLPDPAEVTSPMLSAPSLLRTGLIGLAPSAFTRYANDVTILFAGGGQLATFDAQSLATATAKYMTSVASSTPTVLLHLGDRVLVSEADTTAPGVTRLRLLDDKLSRVSRPELPCAAPEGVSEAEGTVAVGCSEGVLLWQTSGTSTKTLRYPSAVGSERAHKLVASPFGTLFMTVLGDQLCLISDEIKCQDAPADLLDYAFDATGKRALVLSRDGTLYLLDGETLAKRDKLSLLAALLESTPAGELPSLAVGRRNVYVSEPSAARIHIVDSAAAKETGKLDVPGGFPTQVVVFRYDLE
jgi:hypothetical protein